MPAPNSESTKSKPERRTRSVALGRYARNTETAEYIGISVMTLWRWKRDPKLNFPPASVINGVERNNLDEIDAWMKARAVSRVKTDPALEVA